MIKTIDIMYSVSGMIIRFGTKALALHKQDLSIRKAYYIS